MGARAVRLQRVEGARRDEALQRFLVDFARVDATREIAEIGEGRLAARRDDGGGLAGADALHGGERVTDRAPFALPLDREIDAGLVDRGRLDLDAETARLVAEFGELVGHALSSVMDAARNSTVWFALNQAVW